VNDGFKDDVSVAKNYLKDDELKKLNKMKNIFRVWAKCIKKYLEENKSI